MGFIGDAVGSVTRPILGKPDADLQEQGQQASLNTTNAQMALANKLLTELEPLRKSVIQRSTNFMQGGFDPTASALYAPMKGSTESQFNTARGNIMSQLPQGGALFESLANLEGQKAQSLSSLIAQIVADEYQKAYGMASGAPGTAGSIFAGGGQTGVGLSSALAQQQGAGNQALGGAMDMGTLLYLLLKKK